MNNEQLTKELNSILSLLSEQQGEINTIQEKFQVALTGVLRLVGDNTSPTLKNLQGNTEDLKGYLIQLNTEVVKTTTKSYDSLKNKIEEVLELVSSSDRKS
ncbi:MAG: hypothetical protein RTU63_10425 [Candidatus Thorarchaeota archaeon]